MGTDVAGARPSHPIARARARVVVLLSGGRDSSWSPSACPRARADGCGGGTRGRARRERGTRARTTEGDAREGGDVRRRSVGRSVGRRRERSGDAASRVHSRIHSVARWAFEFRARERRGET